MIIFEIFSHSYGKKKLQLVPGTFMIIINDSMPLKWNFSSIEEISRCGMHLSSTNSNSRS